MIRKRIFAILLAVSMLFSQEQMMVFAENIATEATVEMEKEESERAEEQIMTESEEEETNPTPETGVFGKNEGLLWTFDSATGTMTVTAQTVSAIHLGGNILILEELFSKTVLLVEGWILLFSNVTV